MADQHHDEADDYDNLDELAGPSPVENPDERQYYRHDSLELTRSGRESEIARRTDNLEKRQSQKNQKYREYVDGQNAILTELAGPRPIDQGDDHTTTPSSDNRASPSISLNTPPEPDEKSSSKRERVSSLATKLYTISYLILFSFLGTLARLGLQALTFYPGAPISGSVLWANFTGTLVLGFLMEDRQLFREEWGASKAQDFEDINMVRPRENVQHTVDEEKHETEADLVSQKKRHDTIKKTIPLYIGLAVGFCGSFTSFSSFVRDAFLAISNNLPSPNSHPSTPPIPSPTTTVHRNGGYSFMAFLAVLLLTISLSLAALQLGAHVAIAVHSITPTLPFRIMRKYLDPSVVFLAFGCWIGAIILTIFDPYGAWRGEALFALVFAPLGSLARFYTSVHLNGKIASFPLGTFAVNVVGTALLGVFYDLQHAPLGSTTRHLVGGGMLGCQVLQGMMDGFCGCLTTVSTWIAELEGLQRKHSYIYGSASVLSGLGFLIVIMGSLRWTIGFAPPACVT